MRFNHISGLGINALASLLMLEQERRGEEVITLKRAEPIEPKPERISIIAPEPAPEPRRHTGKREAARRLRQLAKRSA